MISISDLEVQKTDSNVASDDEGVFDKIPRLVVFEREVERSSSSTSIGVVENLDDESLKEERIVKKKSLDKVVQPETSRSFVRKHLLTCVVATVCGALVALSTVSTLIALKNKNKSIPSNKNEGESIHRLFRDIIIVENISNESDFENENSPQNKGLKWISHLNTPREYNADFRDRYVLATFIFGLDTRSRFDMPPVESDFCTWDWVDCNEIGNVTGLSLEANDFSGEIVKEIRYFKEITQLSLGFNDLSGTIPSFLLNFPKIEKLDLSDNSFRGQIPSELFTLTRLKYLNLQINELSGNIPAKMGYFTELEDLQLHQNQLTGTIPTELGLLKNLKKLKLNNNKMLSGTIPSEIMGARNLVELDLAGNVLNGTIPENLLQTKIRKLILYQNKISGTIPRSIGNMKRLETIDLDFNALSGVIPSEIGKLLSSKTLAFGNQKNLSGSIPTEMQKLVQLEFLNVRSNKLTGSIPLNFGNLEKLVFFDLLGNTLSGTIPTSIGKLKNVEALILSANQIVGSIPTEIGNLKSLVSLDIDRNNLTGPIPSEVGLMDSLRTAYMGENQLTGHIPSQIGNLKKLKILDLRGNDFFIFSHSLCGPGLCHYRDVGTFLCPAHCNLCVHTRSTDQVYYDC